MLSVFNQHRKSNSDIAFQQNINSVLSEGQLPQHKKINESFNNTSNQLEETEKKSFEVKKVPLMKQMSEIKNPSSP